MKQTQVIGEIAKFFKDFNYLSDANSNLHFLIKCLFLKFLVNNQRIDLEKNNKKLQNEFNLDIFIEEWQKRTLTEKQWEPIKENKLPLGDKVWEWVKAFILETPSFKNQNPMIMGELYEECLHLSHKKSQGIFYTPLNISELMAKNIVKWGDYSKKSEIPRIMDPACGSGSLLVGIYDVMMAHFGKGLKDKEREGLHKKLLEEYLLGIDKDPLACLVTQLILVLKSDQYVYPKGIFCGDILIEKFIEENSLDGIIGNPPYVGHKEIDKDYMCELKKRYPEVYKDKGDLSYCFINRGWELLKPEGVLVHLTSRYFLEAYHGRPLRHFLKSHFEINEIIDFNGLRVISGVGVDPAIISMRKKALGKENHGITIKRFYNQRIKKEEHPQMIEALENKNPSFWEEFQVPQEDLSDDLWRLYSPITKKIIDKIESKTSFQLDNIVQSFQGVITGNDKAFIFNDDDPILDTFDGKILKPWIKNKDVRGYYIENPQKKILYTNEIKKIEEYPEILDYLETHKIKLSQRRECKNGTLPWYRLQWGRDPEHFKRRKIVFPYKATTNRFAIDDKKCFFSADIYGLILKPRLYHQVTEEFLVILLNSQLYNFYFKSFGKKLGDKLYEYYPNTLVKLGIPNIKPENNKIFKDFYGKIKELLKNNNHELMACLKEIDQWFYDYFDLTEEEIKVVEKYK